MTHRKEMARDPLAWIVAALLFGGGGFVGRAVEPTAKVEDVSAERYASDRAEILAGMRRIEDKLDRAIERGLVR